MSDYEDKVKRIEDSEHPETTEKKTRVGWGLPSQNYRPMHNIVTGYRKRLPQLMPQPMKSRDKKV